MGSPGVASQRSMTGAFHDGANEITPLLLSRARSPDPTAGESVAVPISPEVKPIGEMDADTSKQWPHSVRYLVLFCSFIASLSFGVTQVPLLYVFRLMTCDAYYEEHPSKLLATNPTAWPSILLPYSSETTSAVAIVTEHDRCSLRQIEASTALSISLLGASTTIFGLLNLFLTGNLIKRIGVKPALLVQVFFPALRLLIQNVGVEVWGSTGIIIIQCSQIVSIMGGPSGYILCLNTFITEVVDYEGRTAALGRLTGSMFFGSAIAMAFGGIVSDEFGIKAPFRLTLGLFLISCAYVAFCLPHIPPQSATSKDESSSARKGRLDIGRFLGPLAVFAPQRFVGRDGTVRTEFGALLLACGVFLGILATGYLPTLLQLYSTDVFDFGTTRNGWLIFTFSILRGVFLTFAFPKVIAIGRRWKLARESQTAEVENMSDLETEPLLAAASSSEDAKPAKKDHTFAFDLTYTRFSLITDGLLTLLCSFVREGWQMYIAATILPLAAGTSSAAKGTILQMLGSSASSSERTDALAGISLVENMARLSTTFVFGVIFAAFTKMGKIELIFACNAGVALVGFGVLLFARFPRVGSRRLDK